MTPVVRSVRRVVVIPLTIVHGNLHFHGVTMVQTIAAAIVLVPVEILWVIYVWIVLEPVVVPAASGTAPRSPVSIGVGLLSVRNGRG